MLNSEQLVNFQSLSFFEKVANSENICADTRFSNSNLQPEAQVSPVSRNLLEQLHFSLYCPLEDTQV